MPAMHRPQESRSCERRVFLRNLFATAGILGAGLGSPACAQQSSEPASRLQQPYPGEARTGPGDHFNLHIDFMVAQEADPRRRIARQHMGVVLGPEDQHRDAPPGHARRIDVGPARQPDRRRRIAVAQRPVDGLRYE